MKQRIISALGIGVAVYTMTAHAHHSIAAVYDSNQQVTIEGVITAFQLVNPHPYVVMEIKDGNSQTLQWRLEMDNLRELAEIGFDNETLKPGDRIKVTGNPARKQAQSLYIRRLERPADGFMYQQIGGRPSIGSTTRQRRN